MFHNLTPSNAEDVEHANGYALAGWRNAHKLALLDTVPSRVDDHLVTFGDKVIDGGIEVREGTAQHGG